MSNRTLILAIVALLLLVLAFRFAGSGKSVPEPATQSKQSELRQEMATEKLLTLREQDSIGTFLDSAYKAQGRKREKNYTQSELAEHFNNLKTDTIFARQIDSVLKAAKKTTGKKK
jgi:hypothetical protein